MTNPLNYLISELNKENLWEGHLSLQRNDYLKNQGSMDTRLYFIQTGCLRVFVVDDYEEHTIRFGYENNVIAALDSFITEQASDMVIQALRKTEVKVLEKAAFMEFARSTPERFESWLQLLEQLIYQQLERERDLLTSSPAERFRRVLQRSPQLFQEVPHKYIASYLRMTPETLSRLKNN
ncbi:MAG: Crp/Fnr family transcriptional regulator [Cryomorphaceae bacterium]|nr:MAG: Crp/Fnr family transcriptional regulator [Cryomorphaceae bacterium]